MSTALVIIVVAGFVAWKVYAARRRAEGARRMVCPHCRQAGTLSLRPVRVKRGISGGKATGALLTFGVSLLATGLSRKERHLRANCANCGVDWLI